MIDTRGMMTCDDVSEAAAQATLTWYMVTIRMESRRNRTNVATTLGYNEMQMKRKGCDGMQGE